MEYNRYHKEFIEELNQNDDTHYDESIQQEIVDEYLQDYKS